MANITLKLKIDPKIVGFYSKSQVLLILCTASGSLTSNANDLLNGSYVHSKISKSYHQFNSLLLYCIIYVDRLLSSSIGC